MSVNVGSAVAYLDLNISRFQSHLAQATSSLVRFSASSQSVNTKFGEMGKGVSKVGSAMSSVGKSLTTKVTLPIAGLATAAVKTAATFESKMSKVQAISGASGKQMEQLKSKAMEMGAKTKFSASEAADAMSYMGMAGWKTGDMMKGIGPIMNLAAASGEDLASTSDIVTDALTAFGLKAKDSGHFCDVLSAAATNSNTNVGILGESFKYIAPVAGAMGYSVEDVSTALGLMANNGIKGSQAGTALRSMLTNLAKPTDAVTAAMDKYKISLTDSRGNMLPLNELLANMREKFQGLSKEQKTNLAATLAGKEGMSGLLAIMNSSTGDIDKLSNAIGHCKGKTKEMADTMMNNLSGQFTILKSSIETIAIQFGERLMPVVSKVTAKIQEFATHLSKMSDAEKDHIIKIAGIVAAIGPLLLVFGKLLSVFGSSFTIISTLAGGFAKLSEMFVLVAGGAGTFAEAFAAVFPVLSGALPIVGGVIAIVAALALAWKTDFGHIREITAQIVEQIKGILDGLKNITKAALSVVKSLWKSDFASIKTIVTTFIKTFEAEFKTILTIVKNVCKLLNQVLHGDFKGAMNTIVDIGKNVVKLFTNAFKGILTIVGTIVDGVISTVTSWGSKIVSLFITIGEGVVTGFVNFFSKLPERIGYFIGFALGKAIKFATEFPAKAKQAGSKFLSFIISTLTNLPDKVYGFLQKVVAKAQNFAQSFPQKAKQAADSFGKWLISGLQSLPGKMASIGHNIVMGIWNGIQSAKDWVVGKVKDFAGGILKGMKDALDIHSPSRRAKKEVGVMFAYGVIDGIMSKKEAAKKSAAQLSGMIVTAAKDKLQMLKQHNKISLAEEVDYWKKIASACKKGTSAHIQAYKQYIDAKKALSKKEEEQRQSALSKYEKYWDRYSTLHDVSAKKEADYWKKKMKKFKKSSDEYLTAYKNYASAKSKIQSEEYSKQQAWLDKYQTYHETSLKDEVVYWDTMRKTFKKGTDERLDADKKYLEAKKNLEDSEKSLLEQYKADVQTVYDDLQTTIDNYNKTYADAYDARVDALTGAMKLFDTYQQEEGKTAQDMLDSMTSQVSGMALYTHNLNTLAERGIIPDELLQQIKDMGIEAAGNVQTLSTMTDEQLQQWVALWQAKTKLCTEQASKELAPLKDSVEKSINETKVQASNKLTELSKTYANNLRQMTTTSSAIAKQCGKSTSQGIADGINNGKASVKVALSGIVSLVSSSLSAVQSMVAQMSSLSASASQTVGNVSKATSKAVNGSHKNGLYRVPFDGYIAELHEGERVLTKDEAKILDKPQGGGDTFIFNSPKAINEREAARQMKKAKRELALEV